MKGERRHELQERDLDRWVAATPEFFAKHWQKIAIVVVAIGAVVFFFVSQHRQRQTSAVNAQIALTNAESAVRLLEQQWLVGVPPDDETLQALLGDYVSNSEIALEESQDEQEVLRARLQLLEARYEHLLGTWPQAVDDKPQSERLENAAYAFDAVADGNADNAPLAGAAMLGRAAVAEDQGDLDVARALYDELLDDEQMSEFIRRQAGLRLAFIGMIGGSELAGSYVSPHFSAAVDEPEPEPTGARPTGPLGPESPASSDAATDSAGDDVLPSNSALETMLQAPSLDAQPDADDETAAGAADE